MDNIDEKLRQMEDEMNRFEAEISGAPGRGLYGAGHLPSFGNIPPPPTPPMLVPHQINRGHKRAHTSHFSQTSYSYSSEPIVTPPAVVSATPKLYTASAKAAMAAAQAAPPVLVPSAVDFLAIQNEVEKKLKKLKPEKVSVAAEVAISQGKASSALQSFGPDDYKRRGKNRKLMRTAGGQAWEDHSLSDWVEDDFRIFCGDLGNDVTDELLTRTFSKFPSFLRARVVRDKRTNKSKGFGFVSFKDPQDFIKAMKEMNGRYVGSRPIKLRKSTWKSRNIDVVRKKEKEKAALINMLTSGSGR